LVLLLFIVDEHLCPEKRGTTIPPISTIQTITSDLKPLNTTTTNYIIYADGTYTKNVDGLNRLI
jgi:hypothetical protein